MSTASDRVCFLVFCSFCSGALDWRPMATGINVSSQEAPECCQGNESHGATKRIYHAWLVFLGRQGAHAMLHNKACFLLPFRLFGFRRLSHSLSRIAA